MEQIQNTISYHRKKNKLTQKELAKHLGFKDVSRILKWELGRGYPSVINLIKLAKLFKVHAEELYPME